MNASPQFFADDRLHFFRPLTGKYREQVMACLRTLYARLYSSQADYSRIVQRDLVVEVFQEAITRTPVLEASEDDAALPVRADREQAGWMLNLLLEHGWLERHVDEVTLTSTYAFSRIGRLFTQPMHELHGGRFRTRHRNTRNTCNALRSFLDKHEASDLLDAYEYSERIVSDFSDVIAELEERKRELLRDVEAQQLVHRLREQAADAREGIGAGQRHLVDVPLEPAVLEQQVQHPAGLLAVAAHRQRRVVFGGLEHGGARDRFLEHLDDEIALHDAAVIRL